MKDFEEVLRLAEQGDLITQFELGAMYRDGDGVPQNNVEAVKWFSKAAEQGHADAQVNVAIMYQYGMGVPQNDAEAVKWLRKAAEQGNEYAKRWLKDLEAK